MFIYFFLNMYICIHSFLINSIQYTSINIYLFKKYCEVTSNNLQCIFSSFYKQLISAQLDFIVKS